MQYTENYNLNKPELTDVADITKLSENMDIIDEELEKRTTKLGFLTDLITHLASDAAIAISSLSTDSVFYRLLQYALNAAGVQYNFQNSSTWYICLGALFGGLIIQGGSVSTVADDSSGKTIPFPITFTDVGSAFMATLGQPSTLPNTYSILTNVGKTAAVVWVTGSNGWRASTVRWVVFGW